jgi:hypothetical protein
MILNKGEKIHVIERRAFEGDIRRHFVGEIVVCNEHIVRAAGYIFVCDRIKNEFIRKSEPRERIFSLVDARLVINVIPPETQLEKVHYTIQVEKSHNRLIVTDGGKFSLDVHEFGALR